MTFQFDYKMVQIVFTLSFMISTLILIPVSAIVPPKTPVLTGFEPAPIGSRRELVCDATQPDAGTISYKWYKYAPPDSSGFTWEDKGPLKNGTSQTYIFSSISEKQVLYPGTVEKSPPELVSGRYRCRASNSAGTRDSKWEDLYVYQPCGSDYTVSASTSKPSIGSTFTLNCFIPSPSIFQNVQWITRADAASKPETAASVNKHGRCSSPSSQRYSLSSCSPPSSTSRNYNLQVTNAQTTDSAYWFCQDIGKSCESDPLKIVVQAPPGTPQITGFPTGPATAGSQLNLKCNASTPPGDIYEWYKDGAKILTSPSYDIQVKKDSAGVYKCVAKNVAGSTASSEKTLVVYYKPDAVVVSSGKSSCRAGETDRFTCTATRGKPTPTLKIYIKRSGGSPVKVTQGQDRVMVKEDNQAEYYCEAKVAGYPALDMVSTKKKYSVTFANTKVFFTTMPTKPVSVGQNASFVCETDASNPVASIRWYQSSGGSYQDVTKGITISERSGTSVYGGKIRVSAWTVTATKAMKGSTVRCKSIYNVKTGHDAVKNDDTTLNVIWSATELLIVQKPTSPIPTGSSVTIKCETDSSTTGSPGDILWYKGIQPITAGVTTTQRSASDKGIIYTSQLTFIAKKDDNQAKYECKISSQTTKFKKDVILTVHYPPAVKLSAIPTPVKEGETLTLTCDASGGNPTTYQYSMSYKGNKISNQKEYVIQDIKYTQSGTYQCQVVNYSPGGTADASVMIDVQYTARWNPQIPKLFTVGGKVNGAMKFVLPVIANPSPTKVTWFDQNNASATSKGFVAAKETDVTYTLSKTSISIDDYGNYTAKVTNLVGVSTFVFELQKAGPPHTPCCLRTLKATAVSVTLTFKSNFSGGTDQTFTVEKKEGSGLWNVAATKIPDPGFGKDVTRKIPKLQSGTTYEFRVKAVNEAGSSDWNTLAVKTEMAPNVTLLVKRKENLVTVSWGKLPKKYSKIQIKYCLKGDSSCKNHTVKDPSKMEDSFTVEEGKAYHYTMEIFDGEDEVFASSVAEVKATEVPPNGPLIGGIIGTILFVLIVVAIVLAVVFILKKRRVKRERWILESQNHHTEGQVNPGFNEHDRSADNFNPYELEPGMPSASHADTPNGFNPYEMEPGMPSTSSTVQVGDTPNAGSPYDDVDLTRQTTAPIPSGSQPYAEVDFSKKTRNRGDMEMVPTITPASAQYANVDFTKKKKKGKAPSPPGGSADIYAKVKKKPAKPPRGIVNDPVVYENAGMVNDENTYEDVREDPLVKSGFKQPKEAYQVGVDGTIYTEVQIKPPKNPASIKGHETIEEPYASVDFTQEAPKLPDPVDPDDHDDPGFMELL